MTTDRTILLSLIAGLGLADNMGDVADDVAKALKQMHYEVPDWGDLEELSTILGNRGVKTLYGTALGEDE